MRHTRYMKILGCSLQRGDKVDNYKIIELLGESVQLLNIKLRRSSSFFILLIVIDK